MANFYGTARSNYFRFTPERLEHFTKVFAEGIDLDVVHASYPDGERIAIISRCEYGTPQIMIETEEQEEALWALGVENADNVNEIDLRDLIHVLLPPDETLIWIEVGAEKARYLVGLATKIDHTGQPVKHIDLNEIYDKGESRAEY